MVVAAVEFDPMPYTLAQLHEIAAAKWDMRRAIIGAAFVKCQNPFRSQKLRKGSSPEDFRHKVKLLGLPKWQPPSSS